MPARPTSAPSPARAACSLPLSQCGMNVNKSFRPADMDAGRRSRSVRQDHGLFHQPVRLSLGRHQHPGRQSRLSRSRSRKTCWTSKPGIKSDWSLLGMPVRTNLDVYRPQYKNIQTAEDPAQCLAGDRARRRADPAPRPSSMPANAWAPRTPMSPSMAKRAGLWRRMGHHRHPDSAADLELVGQLSGCSLHQFHLSRRRRAICCPPATHLYGHALSAPAWQTNDHRSYAFGLHQIGRRAGGRPGPDRALFLAEPLSGGLAGLQPLASRPRPMGC